MELFKSKKVFVLREQINEGKLKKHFLKFALSKGVVIALSKQYEKRLKDTFKLEKVEVINDGLIPLTQKKEIEREKFNTPPTILFLSNLTKEKGFFDFLELLKILKGKSLQFKAIIAGAPIEMNKEKLIEFLKENELSNIVEYKGYVKGNDKIKTYKESDIFVFPTLKETFPGVVLEAMEFALPVISTREGGIPDIVIEGETGFLVEKRNPMQLAEKVEFLLNNEKTAIKMGKNGRERFFNNFTFDKMENNYLNLFKRILNE